MNIYDLPTLTIDQLAQKQRDEEKFNREKLLIKLSQAHIPIELETKRLKLLKEEYEARIAFERCKRELDAICATNGSGSTIQERSLEDIELSLFDLEDKKQDRRNKIRKRKEEEGKSKAEIDADMKDIERAIARRGNGT